MVLGKLIFVGSFAAAAAGAYLYKDQLIKRYEAFAKSSVRASSEPDFGQLEKDETSEVYLKDSRSFIFSRADEGQTLKLRDSIFVGPASNATLVLADEFGGGRILLAANTVVTLSQAGKKNEIPTLDVRQGEIQIIEAPKPRPVPAARKKSSAKNAASVSIAPLMIVSGTKAVVLDQSLEKAEIKVDAKQELQVTSVSASAIPEKIVDLKQVQAVEVAEKPLAAVIAEIEGTAIPDALAPAPVAPPVAQVSGEETAVLEEERAPASVPETTVAEAELPPPAPVVEEKPKPFVLKKKKEEVQETPEELRQDKLEDKMAESRSLVFDTTEERVEKRKRRFAAKLVLAQRNYDEASEKNSSVDVDLSIEAKHEINEQLEIAAGVEVTAAHATTKSDTGSKAPRPVRTWVELKYHLLADPTRLWRLSLVGGYSYQSSLGTDVWTTYKNVYAPVFGVDAGFRVGAEGYLLLAPRFSWIGSGSYMYIVPATYFWDDSLGVTFGFSDLRLKVSADESGAFRSIGGGMVFKF
jgi:hypothetical protein